MFFQSIGAGRNYTFAFGPAKEAEKRFNGRKRTARRGKLQPLQNANSELQSEDIMHRWILLVIAAFGLMQLPAGPASLADDGTTLNDKVPAAVPLPRSQFLYTPEVVYGRKFGMALTFDVFRPAKNANGAGATSSSAADGFPIATASAVLWTHRGRDAQRGYTIFTVCHGCQPKFNIAEGMADIDRSVRFIRLHAADYGISPDRIGISGGSAGGHLSLMQGVGGRDGAKNAKDPIDRVSSRVQAVGCFFPPTDFLNYGGKGKQAFGAGILFIPWLVPAADFQKFDPKTSRYEHVTDELEVVDWMRKISPIYHVTADTPPTLIIHGDADKLVPIEQSKDFMVELEKHGVPHRLVVKKGLGHGWSGFEKDIPTIADWFDKYLAKKLGSGRDSNQASLNAWSDSPLTPGPSPARREGKFTRRLAGGSESIGSVPSPHRGERG